MFIDIPMAHRPDSYVGLTLYQVTLLLVKIIPHVNGVT